MAEVSLNINGRNYGVACDDGQERRVRELGHYIDQRMKDIARAGAASSENHLMILAALMLADEVFELRDNINDMGREVRRAQSNQQDEAVIAEAIGQLADRIDEIAERVKKA